MIESRLDVWTDGLSSVANAKEYTVAEIATQLRYLAEERRSRSVTSVLRIVSEQTQGRFIIVSAPKALFGFLLPLSLGLLFVTPYVRGPIHPKMIGCDIGDLVVFVVLTIRLRMSHDRRKRYQSQIDEIHRLALEALRAIVCGPEFTPKPLDKGQRKTFGKLRQSDPEGWLKIAKALAKEPA